MFLAHVPQDSETTEAILSGGRPAWNSTLLKRTIFKHEKSLQTKFFLSIK